MKPKGAQKIAAVLLTLDKDTAAQLLEELPDSTLEPISEAMVELASHPNFTANDAEQPVQEYWERINAGALGVNDFEQLLSEALGGEKAQHHLGRLAVSKSQGDPFAPLERLPPKDVAEVLMDENDQVCAITLSNMKPSASAKVFAFVDGERRAGILKRVADLSPTPSHLQERIAALLLERFGPVPPIPRGSAPGLNVAASIMNFLPEEVEQTVSSQLQDDDADLFQAIDERRVTMIDLVGIDKKSMQKVLAGVDTRVLTLALKGAGKDIESAVLENVSKRSRETILEERELLGAIPLSEVEAARNEILTLVRGMIKSGDLVLRRGADEDFVE